MARKVKKGDMVEVITGEAKGTVAKVMRVITSKDRVIVESVNRRYKHVSPAENIRRAAESRLSSLCISVMSSRSIRKLQKAQELTLSSAKKAKRNALQPTALKLVLLEKPNNK